jgi:uncharacterized membrane protein YkoI
MNVMHTRVTTLGGMALGFGSLGGGDAATHREPQHPAYASSIQVQDQDCEERGEAAELTNTATIGLSQATSAALIQVPGTVLKAALDSGNGNLAYSVEVKTSTNEIKDLKVDAGNGTVLHVDEGDVDEEAE